MEATVETTTPASTTETTSTATPATVESVSPTTTSERPTTQRELSAWFAKHDASNAAPELITDATRSAATTTQPSDIKPPASATPPNADENTPAPAKNLAEHKRILDNARTKAVADYRERFGWAEQVPKEKFDQIAAIADKLATDPLGHLRELYQSLSRHAVYGPQLRSEAGRMLANRDVEPKPDVEIRNDQNQVVGMTYSDKALAARDAWNERRILANVQREIGPIKATHEQAEKTRIAEAREKQVTAAVDTSFNDVLEILEITDAKQPDSQKLLAAVNAMMDTHPEWTWEKSARQVWKEQIRPTLEGKALTQALATQKQKAAGNTASGHAAATPMKLKPNASPKEVAAFLRALDVGA